MAGKRLAVKGNSIKMDWCTRRKLLLSVELSAFIHGIKVASKCPAPGASTGGIVAVSHFHLGGGGDKIPFEDFCNASLMDFTKI